MVPAFETLYDRLIKGDEKLALIGLGYVGTQVIWHAMVETVIWIKLIAIILW